MRSAVHAEYLARLALSRSLVPQAPLPPILSPYNGLTVTVDPINGSDNNDGIVLPWKTMKALGDRLSNSIFTVNTQAVLTSDCPDSDVLTLANLLFTNQVQPLVTLNVHGNITQNRAGTVTAVQAENEASNMEWRITDTSVSSWAADVGRLGKITSGANAGNAFHIVKDLGGGMARISPPIVPPLYYDFKPVEGSVSVNDPYAIYTQPKLNLKSVGGDCWSDNNHVMFDELYVNGPAGSQGGADVIFNSNELAVGFRRCHIDRPVFGATGTSLQLVHVSNCYMQRLIAGGIPFGMVYEAGAIGAGALIGAGFNGHLVFDGNIYIQGSSLTVDRGSLVSIGKAAFFDVSGAAVTVRGGGRVLNRNFDYSGHRLWGYNNGGGVSMFAGGLFEYDSTVPNINAGGANEFMLSGASQARAWDETVSPNGGPTSLRNCTWANLAASVASGGFGGQAKNFTTDAAIRQNV